MPEMIASRCRTRVLCRRCCCQEHWDAEVRGGEFLCLAVVRADGDRGERDGEVGHVVLAVWPHRKRNERPGVFGGVDGAKEDTPRVGFQVVEIYAVCVALGDVCCFQLVNGCWNNAVTYAMFLADGPVRGKGDPHHPDGIDGREREAHLHVRDAGGAHDERVGDVVARVVVARVVVRHVEIVGEQLVGGRLGRRRCQHGWRRSRGRNCRVELHGERLRWCTDGDVDPVLQASVAV
jgi:hypothetical protein